MRRITCGIMALTMIGLSSVMFGPADARPKTTTGSSGRFCSCVCQYKDGNGNLHTSISDRFNFHTAQDCSIGNGISHQCTGENGQSYSGNLRGCTEIKNGALAPLEGEDGAPLSIGH